MSSTDTTSVLLEFFLTPEGRITAYYPIPNHLLHDARITALAVYEEYYAKAVFPCVAKHEAEFFALSATKCVVCGTHDTEFFLITNMSYLHLKEQPKVSFLVTPVCHMEQCDAKLRAKMEGTLWDVMGNEDTVSQGFVARNASCPCGSGRKFKKCCGKAEAKG